MKKILSLILALLMIVSCASVIFADDAVTAAAPADETASAYYDAVNFLVNYDIMHGKGDTLGVYDDIKRYEMALFIGRICTGWVDDAAWEDGPENTSNFIDLAGTAAENYYGAISYVANKGIIEGVGGNRFAPEAGIKYEDALTMAVRALGYTGLAYPWGYIEKADELGLTDGIKGVAYTETLKREVVAQIVFNALYAEKADGETLGLKNFGITNDYEVAIITASDGGIFYGGDTKAAEGYVKYAIVAEDGKMGEKRFTASAATFGLEGEHADELALGAAFKVIRDADGKILSAESLALDPVVNAGRNSREAGQYPIQAFLADVTLLDTLNFKSAEAAGKFMAFADDVDATIVLNEFYAVDWYSGNILHKDTAGNYTVEWYYNQLLDSYFQEQRDANGKLLGIKYATKTDAFKNVNAKDKNTTVAFEECYGLISAEDDVKAFKKATAYAKLALFDTNCDGEADYGIYDAYRLGKTNTTSRILDVSALVVGDDYDTIIAHHKDWFGYDKADDPEFLATLGFPKFTAASEKYINAGVNIDDYSEVPNGGEPFGTFPFKSHETVNVKGCKEGFVSFQNGGATANGKIVYLGLSADAIWTSDGQPLVDGEWVIYGAQPATNEVTIVERLGEYEEGKETYVATGVLRAYSTAKKTVTIGDQEFSTSYDELAGSTFTSAYYKDDVWYKGSEYLAQLFNQYVTYVVVDEKVVFVEAYGAEEYNFLVVDNFAGIDKEGYIVIDAWDTRDGAHKQVRIDSCDNWKFGDMFYYAENYANYSSLFTPNTYLRILSYNKENNAYNVTAVNGLNNLKKQTGFTYNANKNGVTMSGDQTTSAAGFDFVWFMMDFRYASLDTIYYIYQGKARPAPTSWGDGADAWTAAGGADKYDSTNGLATNNMTDEDKYVMIFAPGEIAGSPVRIYEGKVKNPDWYIQGWRLVGTDAHTHIYFGLRAGDVNGFNVTKEASKKTLVMIPEYKDPNDLGSWIRPELGHTSGWQIQWGSSGEYFVNADQHPWGYRISSTYGQADENLLGNTKYDVVVLDMRTLETITVSVSNKNMVPNFVYECINGQVVGGPKDAGEFYELLLGTYGNQACDLENDLTELYTTSYNTKDKYSAQEPGGTNDNWIHAGYTAMSSNKWMTKKWLGAEYGDFGQYTINREWANNAVIAVYEGNDGHIEITPLGMGGGKDNSTAYNITKNGAYGEWPVHGDYSYGTAYDEDNLYYAELEDCKVEIEKKEYDEIGGGADDRYKWKDGDKYYTAKLNGQDVHNNHITDYKDKKVIKRNSNTGNPAKDAIYYQQQNTVDYFLSGTRHVSGGVKVQAVTVINMDNVKLQRNLDPYGNGLAQVTWLFNEKDLKDANNNSIVNNKFAK